MKPGLLLMRVVTYGVRLSLNLQLAWPMAPQITVPAPSVSARPTTLLPGQTVTLLPDGRWLLLGGQGKSGPLSTAVVENPRTNSATTLTIGMIFPRAWHSATLLSDGRVLIVGGTGSNKGIVETAELFDPNSTTAGTTVAGLLPRKHHTATLLTDGRVLVAGGIGNQGT